MKVLKVATSAALGLGVVAASLLAPASAEAATRCTGPEGFWQCYTTTTGPVYARTIVDRWPVINDSPRRVTASCRLERAATFSTSTNMAVSAHVKYELFKVAELTVGGTQERNNTLTVSESVALAATFVLNPGESATCRLIHGYYRVGTKYERFSNYRVIESRTGTTTVPFSWGLQVV